MTSQTHKIKLRPPQLRVFRDPSRFIAVCAGRRFGKTFLASSWLAREITRPDSEHAYFAPTYKDAKRIMWKRLEKTIPRSWLSCAPNKSELLFSFVNGAQLRLIGLDRPQGAVGTGYNSVCLDECRYFDVKSIFDEQIRPALSDKRGRALLISSPSGYDGFYDYYRLGLGADPDWSSYHFTTIDGGNVPPEEIESAKRNMPEKLFRQEYLASFELMSGRVYYAFDRNLNVKPCKYLGGDIIIGLDFNVDPMSGVICQRVADEIQQFDELVIYNSNTEEACLEIKRRYPNAKVTVYPDPSGRARKTSASGNTDFTIIQKYFNLYAPRAPYAVEDRINTTNAAMCSADGHRRFYVDPSCTVTIKCFEGMAYKEGTKVPDKTLGLDHMPDGAGYLLMAECPMNRTPSVQIIGF